MPIRALWSQSYQNRTVVAIQSTVNKALAMNANAIYMNVHEGGAHYNSAFITRSSNIEQGLDPLLYLVDLAHRNGIQVYPWIAVGYDIAKANNSLWIHFDDVDKDWADLRQPAARQALIDIVDDIDGKYDIDGIALDYIRYPKTTDPRAHKDHVNLLVQTTYQHTQSLGLPLVAAVASNPIHNGAYLHQRWDEWLAGEYIDTTLAMCYYDNQSDIYKMDWERQNIPLQYADQMGFSLSPFRMDNGQPKKPWQACDEVELVRSWKLPHFAIFDSGKSPDEHLNNLSRVFGPHDGIRAVSFNPRHRLAAIIVEGNGQHLILWHDDNPFHTPDHVSGKTDAQVRAMLPAGVWCYRNPDGVWSLHIGDTAPDWTDTVHPDDGEAIPASRDDTTPQPPSGPDWAKLARIERQVAERHRDIAALRDEIATEYESLN